MKRNILLLMSLLLLMSANADEYYAKFLSGVNFLQNTYVDDNKTTYQPGYIVAGSLGYSWYYGVSLEAEYAYRRNAISKIQFFGQGDSTNGHFQTSSYMANLLWNVPLCLLEDIQPFIGAGIGYDHEQLRSSNDRIVFNQKWNHLSWQLMAGLSYPVLCNSELTLEYKFHQGGCHFYNHSIGVGLVYTFGLFNN